MQLLDNKVAIVTGVGSGMSKAVLLLHAFNLSRMPMIVKYK